MLKRLLIEPFQDRNYLLGILIWIIFLPLSVGIIGLALWGIDAAYLPIQNSKGIIESKHYNKSYVYITYVHAGKVSVPITNRKPERYSLNISINGTVDNFTIPSEYFSYFDRGESVQCEYTQGRIFNTVYIKSIDFVIDK